MTPRTPRPHRFAFALALVLLVLFGLSRDARAERELIVPFHEGGHVVLDQLSGLRIRPADGFSYAGPAGIVFRSETIDGVGSGSAGEASTTTLWLAPSADVFVTDHFSLGGLVEIGHTWGTARRDGQDLELPGATSMTFLPRVGFYVPFTDRIGLWPRAGVGYASVESVSFASSGGAPVRETFRAMVLELDLSVVYRFGETFFMRAGPDVGVTVGGRHATEQNDTNSGAGGSVIQISGVVAFGLNLEL